MDTKRQLYAEEKARIGRYAAGLIADDDIVYLDAGTTVMQVAEQLPPSQALFVTNSIECARRLTERGMRAYVLGGKIKTGTLAIIGAETLRTLSRYNFTKAFLGTNGITLSQGFTTPDPEEAAIKALAAERAKAVYILSDSSKFGKITATIMFPLETAQIITDHLPDRRFLEHTEIKEV